jgi:hypothetical protein
MIKIKIQNPIKHRNEITFRPFLQLKNVLREYSIDITESDDYDFLFVGMADFIDKSKSLHDSINYGLDNLDKISGDYFLFDGSDSTSLMGAYEVFEQSNATYLFKNQILKNKDMYKNSYAFGKWFFNSESDLDLSYDISSENWNKIKLTNINCGRTIFGTGVTNYLNQLQPVLKDKSIDICAIFQGNHGECYDHKVRNDIPYTEHRKGLWEKLDTIKNKYLTIADKLPFQEYVEKLAKSKICLSPFGMGELCFRDFESIMMGTIMLKPNQSNVITTPNIYVEGETYIGCKLDWSDVGEKIDFIMSNFRELNDKITYNARKMMTEQYTDENFGLHYYDIFSNLESIQSDG